MNENKKILLSSAKSKTSVNDDILLNIDISSDEKKLPSEDITANIDQYKQYIKENDEGNGNVDRKHHIQQYGWDRHNEKHNSRQQI